MYATTVLFFILGVIATWVCGLLIYRFSFLSKLPVHNSNFPLWENMLYYLIALYPILSYIILVPAGRYYTKLGLSHEDLYPIFIAYVSCHVIISILSASVIRYLVKRRKLNYIFAMSTCFAGGIYIAAGIVVSML